MYKPLNGVFRVLVCRIQSRLCGLPLDAVEETLRPQPLRPLASPVVHVQGLARIRGDWLPVVDLGGLLGLEPVAPRRYVVVHAGRHRVALAVTEVLGLQALPADEVRTLPPLLRDREHGAIAALAERDNDLIAVLDQARLLPEASLAALHALEGWSQDATPPPRAEAGS
ncbi:chemotaxis protein CheW [Mitsuaria sp. 7]|uniref:chemotaxis protein CheW n=1 Tax=Mitsuaria sp. 7 TaxID=1658665 RepID=UPI0009EEE4DA|nr:chemotaxis protein CheW [Mitsuaria sp. 7]